MSRVPSRAGRRAHTPLVVELYCGTFGWSRGWLARGGLSVGFDIEHLPHHGPVPPGATLVLQDVRTLHGSRFAGASLILASPPCQEFSYRAMPWKRARTMPPPDLGMELFEACFRIQREASAAAGRHIPLVVENVRGAQRWVGRARWNFGSYYLWGDVPALMPVPHRPWKNAGGSWYRVAHNASSGTGRNPVKSPHFTNPAEHEGVKAPGADWSRKELGPQDFTMLAAAAKKAGKANDDPKLMQDWGRKGFASSSVAPLGKSAMASSSSRSSKRKVASALIAQIPARLSDWIAECYWPAGAAS